MKDLWSNQLDDLNHVSKCFHMEVFIGIQLPAAYNVRSSPTRLAERQRRNVNRVQQK